MQKNQTIMKQMQIQTMHISCPASLSLPLLNLTWRSKGTEKASALVRGLLFCCVERTRRGHARGWHAGARARRVGDPRGGNLRARLHHSRRRSAHTKCGTSQTGGRLPRSSDREATSSRLARAGTSLTQTNAVIANKKMVEYSHLYISNSRVG
jgi:hypothetical protein